MAEVAVCPSLVARELLLRRAVPYFSVFSLSARGTSKVNLGERTVMYEDSWYSFVPELPSKKDDASSQSSKHNRRESLLRQANVRSSTVVFKIVLTSCRVAVKPPVTLCLLWSSLKGLQASMARQKPRWPEEQNHTVISTTLPET